MKRTGEQINTKNLNLLFKKNTKTDENTDIHKIDIIIGKVTTGIRKF